MSRKDDHDGALALESACAQPRYVDTITESGLLDLAYRVSAVDESDNESALSTTVSVVVDMGEPIISDEMH